jgi:hypothetical protein
MENTENKQRGFGKSERSTFSYWFAHWCAYNMVALTLHAWKFKYLFHDIEKPWLRLFMEYEKVQKFHRTHNRHHPQYKGGVDRFDFEAMLIDWECSRYTKISSPKTGREMITDEVLRFQKTHTHEDTVRFQTELYRTADKLKI